MKSHVVGIAKIEDNSKLRSMVLFILFIYEKNWFYFLQSVISNEILNKYIVRFEDQWNMRRIKHLLYLSYFNTCILQCHQIQSISHYKNLKFLLEVHIYWRSMLMARSYLCQSKVRRIACSVHHVNTFYKNYAACEFWPQ